MCTREYFYSITTDKEVIEFEQFGNTYVFWLYPEADRFSTLKDMPSIDEIALSDGNELINELKTNKRLYHVQVTF